MNMKKRKKKREIKWGEEAGKEKTMDFVIFVCIFKILVFLEMPERIFCTMREWEIIGSGEGLRRKKYERELQLPRFREEEEEEGKSEME